ncbi:MAG: hypothetical protein C0403_08690 [Desulfobacterium sp.]|nr:hypothetical protein [Desulfobacterium sp.]
MPVIKLTSMKLRFTLKSNTGNHKEYGQPQGLPLQVQKRSTERIGPPEHFNIYLNNFEWKESIFELAYYLGGYQHV